MKLKNLIVVDDFLDNPDAVREYALAQQYKGWEEGTGLVGIVLNLMGQKK